VNFNVAVAYSADLDKVFAVIDRVGKEMAADASYRLLVLEAPRAAGVDKLGESTVEVRVTGVTAPGEQWAVAGELRRRLKHAFDSEGIRIKDG
jgi:small conductance mechanosensitive channel